jgi:hypothetical protein
MYRNTTKAYDVEEVSKTKTTKPKTMKAPAKDTKADGRPTQKKGNDAPMLENLGDDDL